MMIDVLAEQDSAELERHFRCGPHPPAIHAGLDMLHQMISAKTMMRGIVVMSMMPVVLSWSGWGGGPSRPITVTSPAREACMSAAGLSASIEL